MTQDPKIIALESTTRQHGASIEFISRQIQALSRPETLEVVNLSAASPALIGVFRGQSPALLVKCDATLKAFTVLLPSAKGTLNTTIYIKKTDASANAVTVTPKPGETINGATTLSLTTAHESKTLVSDGENWHIV